MKWNKSGPIAAVVAAVAVGMGPVAQAQPATAQATSPVSASAAAKVTGNQVVSRAQVWVKNHVKYNQGKTYKGYRTDCSGYVSMAWGLAKPGATTRDLPRYGKYISKGQLKRGDVLLKYKKGGQGHVLIFDKWVPNTGKKYYMAYEESTSKGAVHRKTPYPYFKGYGTFKPFRYKNLA